MSDSYSPEEFMQHQRDLDAAERQEPTAPPAETQQHYLGKENGRDRMAEIRAREAAGEKIDWAERRPDPRSSIAQGVQLYKTTVRSYVMEWRSAYPMGCYAVVGKHMDRVCILERGHDNGKHESC